VVLKAALGPAVEALALAAESGILGPPPPACGAAQAAAQAAGTSPALGGVGVGAAAEGEQPGSRPLGCRGGTGGGGGTGVEGGAGGAGGEGGGCDAGGGAPLSARARALEVALAMSLRLLRGLSRHPWLDVNGYAAGEAGAVAAKCSALLGRPLPRLGEGGEEGGAAALPRA
jgi:hypothetical protein